MPQSPSTAAAIPRDACGGQCRGRGAALTVRDQQLQADRLGVVALQDALVVTLVTGLSVVQLQRGAAARHLLPVLRQGHGGAQPADGGIVSALRVAPDAQGPAPRPVGRQRPDPQAAGGCRPHPHCVGALAGATRSRALCLGQAPGCGARGAGAGNRGSGRTCRGVAHHGGLRSGALLWGGFSSSSLL